ncbi:50S ribosomal protein L29 [candidate division WOR-3 bacterium]|nr:50S ribosomal protein L29 [candidate division WOR-3 bacterium]
MKTKEIRELTDKELLHRLDEVNEEIFKLRFRVMSNTTDKPANIRNAKKEKAKILTIMNERDVQKKRNDKNE